MEPLTLQERLTNRRDELNTLIAKIQNEIDRLRHQLNVTHMQLDSINQNLLQMERTKKVTEMEFDAYDDPEYDLWDDESEDF